MIGITVSHVDGGMSKWNENTDIIDKLERLETSGYTGKSLLDILITDDWGVPPKFVTFEGIYQGKKYSRNIRYE